MFDKIKSSTAFQRATELLLPFMRKFLNDWSLNFAGMLAYSLLIALVPLAVALFGIIGFILKGDLTARQRFADQVINFFPPGTLRRTTVEDVVNLAIIELTEDAGALFAVGLIFAIFGAGQLFVAIDKCFTIIYRIPQRSFLRRNLVAMEMVFVFIVLFTIIITSSSAPTIVTNGMESNSDRFQVHSVGVLSSLLVAFGLFEIIYLIVPNKKMSFAVTWCGALVAACLLEIVIMWFPTYVQENTNSYTGVVGFAILFILLLYYFSLILILGAQINAYYFEHYLPLDEEIGTCIKRVYDEHIDDPLRRPLVDQNADTTPLQYQ